MGVHRARQYVSYSFVSGLTSRHAELTLSMCSAVAREVTEDDHYDGFFIPKGATIMANNYAISRDEAVFPDPESFVPTRFLDESGQKLRTDILQPMEFAFGFGRRTCPGRYLADALLFSHFAHILKVFDVALPAESEKAQRAADAELKVKSNGAAWCVLRRLSAVVNEC